MMISQDEEHGVTFENVVVCVFAHFSPPEKWKNYWTYLFPLAGNREVLFLGLETLC